MDWGPKTKATESESESEAYDEFSCKPLMQSRNQMVLKI